MTMMELWMNAPNWVWAQLNQPIISPMRISSIFSISSVTLTCSVWTFPEPLSGTVSHLLRVKSEKLLDSLKQWVDNAALGAPCIRIFAETSPKDSAKSKPYMIETTREAVTMLQPKESSWRWKIMAVLYDSCRDAGTIEQVDSPRLE